MSAVTRRRFISLAGAVQIIQPVRKWVFKTPHHLLGGIGGLLKVWPGVKLVMTHRHVGQVLPSYCSMCASLSINSSSTYRKEDQGAHWSRRFRTGLERLEAQATAAQLAMLRYQLNPHFLFNTLNSISTLVLLKQTEQANAMLSRLSSFLRFTLINEAAAKVPLTQEIETLKLYLDIEKMRFEERLRTYFTIEPAVEDALVPSLLLQPLVENAIKYAVTPKEEGADISVTAQLVGQRVRITVSDTGPGLQPGQQDHSLSTGVGMANTRERLSQAYGDDQRFEHYVKAGGGFEVLLELPYQSRIIAGEDNQTGAKQQGQISA